MVDTIAHPPTDSSFTSGEMKMLLEMSLSLHRWINIDDLLPYIVSAAKDFVDAETVAILLHDPSRNEFFFRFSEGNPTGGASVLKEIRFPSDSGIAGSVFKSGRPEMIPDVTRDSRHYKQVDGITKFETRSIVAVPLQTKEKTIGVLEACNKKRGEFDEKDVNLLTSIAGTVAMALENARLYAELREAYEELQRIDRAKDGLIERTKEENARLRREIEGRYRFDQIRGNSPQILDLFRLCEKVINSDITVLIEGETGTGKELIARCLHYNGPRKEKRFIVQNCGGIPDPLLASELFGHVRGAFTGAVSDKKGIFEIANGGTIVLDEVAEMSPAMQVSLLRVLQEGEIKPLGADETKRIDVRLISATNRSLENDVKNGNFREDLYYRLSVFTIRVPALREREGDIPILAEEFVRKFNRKFNRTVMGLSKKVQECLSAYPFPGNVRELENEIERAVILADDGKHIEIHHLSEKIGKKSTCTDDRLKTDSSLKDMVEDLEKRVLRRKLEEHRGNKARVARELGLSRFGLAKKMKRYGFSPS